MDTIKFGTDGFRGILNKDFTYKNVDKIINAIATYIYIKSKYGKKVLIGYDPRNKADEFASYIADRFSQFGFRVELSDEVVATPVLAYSALYKNANAIMVTASHNPSEYLGIKFIPNYGGPCEDYITKIIIDNINNEFKLQKKPETIITTNFEDDYIRHIKKIINFKKLSKLEINYDGHHGAAGALFLRILDENNIKYNAQNIERDINFGGFMPDPKEEYLPSLKALCQQNGKIGLSNDGDGDRFGVFDENGKFIPPNDIIAMLLRHLVINKKLSGKLAKTVGTSVIVDLYAKKYDVEVVETPVGFKWLGHAMRNDDILIAGEESGGLSIKGHIPEKDGILANLLIMEMMAYNSSKLCELHKEFLSEFDYNFVNKRYDMILNKDDNPDEIINQKKKLKKIAGLYVVKTSDIDGLKIYLEDKSTILIRKSGTEPLLRFYFEATNSNKIEVLKNDVMN